MSLVDQIRLDVQRITGNTSEFATPIVFEDKFGTTATVPGTRTNHHLGIRPDGVPVNTKQASVSVSEAAFPVDYTVRNSAGLVALKGHKVSYADSTGLTKQYVIEETYPDEKLGLIVCILRDFQ